MESILIVLVLIATVVTVITLLQLRKSNENKLTEEQIQLLLHQSVSNMKTDLTRDLGEVKTQLASSFGDVKTEMSSQMMTSMSKISNNIVEGMKTMDSQLNDMSESFGKITPVHEEMKKLNKTLNSVRSRGEMGEVVLDSILEQHLSPTQYVKDLQLGEGRANVEFALRLPVDGEKDIFVPIDSKFPLDVYTRWQEAYEEGDADKVKSVGKEFNSAILNNAKLITKYLDKDTAGFGIMFIPVEAMFQSIVSQPQLMNEIISHKIYVAGPSTIHTYLMMVLLGYRNMYISQNIRKVLSLIKDNQQEFGKFKTAFDKVGDALEGTMKKYQSVAGTRVNVLERNYGKVEALMAKGEGDDDAPMKLAS